MALGWHAKSGDDDLDDTVLTGGLVTALIALAIISAVVALAVFGVGGLIALAAGAVIFLLIIGIASLGGWLTGQ